MGKEEQEKICVQRFLNWYNKQHKRNYIHQRAEDCFPELKGGLRWEFVAFERDNPKKWIGIELKDLATTREVSNWFEFWEGFCSKLTQDLVVKGVQGKFKIIHPPVLITKGRERSKLKRAFIEVLINKQSMLKESEFTDIGPDIADRFTKWPREKIRNLAEYNDFGEDRPCELLINKMTDSGCEVRSPISPIRARDGVKQHKETFNEVDIKHANKQLKLAKERGARETILLFACYPFVYENLIKNEAQNLDSHLICDIDYIYLVGMNKDIVVKIYPD